MKKLTKNTKKKLDAAEKRYQDKILEINGAVIHILEWAVESFGTPAELMLSRLKAGKPMNFCKEDLKILGHIWENLRKIDKSLISWATYLQENNRRTAKALAEWVGETKKILVEAGISHKDLKRIIAENDVS